MVELHDTELSLLCELIKLWHQSRAIQDPLDPSRVELGRLLLLISEHVSPEGYKAILAHPGIQGLDQYMRNRLYLRIVAATRQHLKEEQRGTI